MKTIKLCCALLSLVLIRFTALADGAKAAKFTSNYTVNSYVKMVVNGDLSAVADAIDEHARFKMLRGTQILSFTKDEMLAFVSQNEGVVQTCVTTTTPLSLDADQRVIRVDMKYSNFTRCNYVTMTNIGGNWKITEVYSVFK